MKTKVLGPRPRLTKYELEQSIIINNNVVDYLRTRLSHRPGNMTIVKRYVDGDTYACDFQVFYHDCNGKLVQEAKLIGEVYHYGTEGKYRIRYAD